MSEYPQACRIGSMPATKTGDKEYSIGLQHSNGQIDLKGVEVDSCVELVASESTITIAVRNSAATLLEKLVIRFAHHECDIYLDLQVKEVVIVGEANEKEEKPTTRLQLSKLEVVNLELEDVICVQQGQSSYGSVVLKNANYEKGNTEKCVTYGDSEFKGGVDRIEAHPKAWTYAKPKIGLVLATNRAVTRLDIRPYGKVMLEGQATIHSIYAIGNTSIELDHKSGSTRNQLTCDIIRGEPANTLDVSLAGSTLVVKEDISNVILNGPGKVTLQSASGRNLDVRSDVDFEAGKGTHVECIKGQLKIVNINGAHLRGRTTTVEAFELVPSNNMTEDAFKDSIVEDFKVDLGISGQQVLSGLEQAKIVNPSLWGIQAFSYTPHSSRRSGIEVLDRLCREKSTQGNVRTQVAHAAATNRMKTAGNWMERWLLKAYSLLSFAQRPGRPLIAWLVVIAISGFLIALQEATACRNGPDSLEGYLKTLAIALTGGESASQLPEFSFARATKVFFALVAEPFTLLQVRTGQGDHLVPWTGTALSFQRLALGIPFAALLVSIRRITRVTMQ